VTGVQTCALPIWTAHLLKLRTEFADVFTDGDYQPLQVSGPHRDHIVAFARRKGSKAAIVAVARHLAPFTEGGRAWPKAAAFEGTLDLTDSGIETTAALTLSALFTHLPVAVVRAAAAASARPARKRVPAEP